MSLAIKPSNTPSASPNRPSAGRPRGHAIPTRLTAGPGWSWPATPSCAWPARPPATSGCRGSGPDPSRACHPTAYAAGFRACVHARLAGHHAETRRTLPRTTQRPLLWAGHSLPGHQEAHQQAQEEAVQGRLIGPATLQARQPQSTAKPSTPGLNHKLKGASFPGGGTTRLSSLFTAPLSLVCPRWSVAQRCQNASARPAVQCSWCPASLIPGYPA